MTDTWTAVDEAAYEGVVADICEAMGPGMEPSTRARVQAQTTPAGRRLAVSFLGADGQVRLTVRDLHVQASEIESLAHLGYQTAQSVAEAVRVIPRLDTVLGYGVTPERIAVLARRHATLGRHGSGWYVEALLSADLTALDKALEAAADRERYLGVLRASGRTDRADRTEMFFDHGILRQSWIESDHDLVALEDMTEAVGSRKDAAEFAVRLLDQCFTPADVRDYGTTICDDFTAAKVATLRHSSAAPKAIRSLHAALRWHDLEGYVLLAEAGLVSGRDAKVYVEALATNDPHILVKAHEAAPTKVIGRYHSLLGRTLTADDLPAVKMLTQHHVDADHLVEYARANHAEANRYSTTEERVRVLHWYADMVSRGVTPERFGVLTRAGIPIPEVAKFADSTDPWSDGQPFRDHYEAEEARLAREWGSHHGSAREWAFTETTYRDPEEQKATA